MTTFRAREKFEGYVEYLQRGTFNFIIDRGVSTDIIKIGNQKIVFGEKNDGKLLGLINRVNASVRRFLRDTDVSGWRKYGYVERSCYNNLFGFVQEKWGELICTDLNHCYWSVAGKLGIISDELYRVGVADYYDAGKGLMLNIALGCLARRKTIFTYVDGVQQGEGVLWEDEERCKVYGAIVRECYRIMKTLYDELEGDALIFIVDGICYKPARKKEVHEYFSDLGYEFKDEAILSVKTDFDKGKVFLEFKDGSSKQYFIKRL